MKLKLYCLFVLQKYWEVYPGQKKFFEGQIRKHKMNTDLYIG